jgi:hypothetical protein
MDVVSYICLYLDSFKDLFLLVQSCKKWYYLLIPKSFITIDEEEKKKYENKIGKKKKIIKIKKNY